MEHQRPLCSRGAAVHFPTFPDSTIMQSILQLSAFLESFSPFLFIVLSLFILLLNKSIVDRDLLVVNPVLESLASSRSLDIGQYLSFIFFSSLTPLKPLSLSPFRFVSEPIHSESFLNSFSPTPLLYSRQVLSPSAFSRARRHYRPKY